MIQTLFLFFIFTKYLHRSSTYTHRWFQKRHTKKKPHTHTHTQTLQIMAVHVYVNFYDCLNIHFNDQTTKIKIFPTNTDCSLTFFYCVRCELFEKKKKKKKIHHPHTHTHTTIQSTSKSCKLPTLGTFWKKKDTHEFLLVQQAIDLSLHTHKLFVFVLQCLGATYSILIPNCDQQMKSHSFFHCFSMPFECPKVLLHPQCFYFEVTFFLAHSNFFQIVFFVT